MDIQRQRMSCYRNQRPIVIVCSVPITTDGLLLQNHDASRVKARRGAFSRYLAWLVWRESLASFPLILGVADKPAEQAVTTILCPPEVGGQSKANQTERRHQDLLWDRSGKHIGVAVDNRCLNDLEANHRQTGKSRSQHSYFTCGKDGCGGEEKTSPNDEQQQQARDGVVTERRTLQVLDRHPQERDRSSHQTYAVYDRSNTDERLDHDERDAYSFMFHDVFSLLEVWRC